MPDPLPSLSLCTPPAASKRKRSDSTLEIFPLSLPYDIKRARTGIEELTTEDSPPLPSLVNSLSSAATVDSPEIEMSTTDTSADSLSTSSSSEGSLVSLEADEGYDSDSEPSSTSTSSSSSSSDSEQNSRPRSAPIDISSPSPMPTSNTSHDSISSRIQAFLPTLAAANAQLEQEGKQGTLESRDIEKVNGEQYIQMDLGLGVLEEKRPSASRSESESGTQSDDVDDANDAEDESEVTDATQLGSRTKKRQTRKRKRNIMSHLMGRGGSKVEKPEITVVGDENS